MCLLRSCVLAQQGKVTLTQKSLSKIFFSLFAGVRLKDNIATFQPYSL